MVWLMGVLALVVWTGAVQAGVIGTNTPQGVPIDVLAARMQTKQGLMAVPPGVDLTRNVRYHVPNDPLYPSQWHLSNGSGYPHANIESAWDRVTGSGVVIGIVDDSLETAHPDLAPNYVAAHSWDFGQNDADPNPVYSDDGHGISVAGVAAARGDNLQGVTGAAPQAGLAGLRIDFPNQTTQMFVDATLYHSSGGDTSIDVKNHSYGVGVGFISETAIIGALDASAAAGTIHVVAAGNERFEQESHNPYYDGDANKKHFQSSPNSIVVAALGADGQYSYYSNWGANVFVTAPSNGALGLGITTTDRTGALGYGAGDYVSFFGGTSSTSPLVAGVMALGVEANPSMDVRMAKHLLAMTSDVVDPGDVSATGGWQTNAAGYNFNQNYGFGLIDADEFSALAATAAVSPQGIETAGPFLVDLPIPAGAGDWFTDTPLAGPPATSTFNLLNSGTLEEVEITMDISHTWRGDLEAYLTSPSGTMSRLFHHNWGDDGTFGAEGEVDWTFTSNEFWGEDPAGEWTLSIVDVYDLDFGIWHGYSVAALTGSVSFVSDTVIPEPATCLLLALGALGLRIRRRRQ
jgi:subtilisin family serine protease